jgi:hypothetical protein
MDRDTLNKWYNNLLFNKGDIMRQNYRKATLKTLMSHENPTLRDVRIEMCDTPFCPEGKCPLEGDLSKMGCGHILAVSVLAARVNNVLMGN